MHANFLNIVSVFCCNINTYIIIYYRYYLKRDKTKWNYQQEQ